MRGWPVAPLDSGDHGTGILVSGGPVGVGKLPNLPPLQLFVSELIPDLGAELRFGCVQVSVQGVNQLFEFPYRSLGENNPGIPGVIDVVDQLWAVHDVAAGSRCEEVCSCTDITSSNTKVLGLTA